MATQDDYIRTALRVPPELHGNIHEAAKANNRTFNAEIVARLEASFGAPTPSSRLVADRLDASLDEVIERIADAVAERTSRSKQKIDRPTKKTGAH